MCATERTQAQTDGGQTMTACERQRNMTAYLESLIVYQKTIIIGKANVGGQGSQNKDVKVEVILRRRQDGGRGSLPLHGRRGTRLHSDSGRKRSEIISVVR
jgi:hypothetical protein